MDVSLKDTYSIYDTDKNNLKGDGYFGKTSLGNTFADEDAEIQQIAWSAFKAAGGTDMDGVEMHKFQEEFNRQLEAAGYGNDDLMDIMDDGAVPSSQQPGPAAIPNNSKVEESNKTMAVKGSGGTPPVVPSGAGAGDTLKAIFTHARHSDGGDHGYDHGDAPGYADFINRSMSTVDVLRRKGLITSNDPKEMWNQMATLMEKYAGSNGIFQFDDAGWGDDVRKMSAATGLTNEQINDIKLIINLNGDTEYAVGESKGPNAANVRMDFANIYNQHHGM